MRTSASFLSADLNANPHAIEIVRGAGELEVAQNLKKRISERAYELYDNAGRPQGRHEEDWLQAEREVLQRLTQVRESGSWVIANLYVPNIPAEGFRLLISEERALVEVEEPAATRKPAAGCREQQFSFYTVHWPAPVDPATASAYVKNGTLTLEVKLCPHPSQAKRMSASSKG
jgi:hypothetical protein